MLYYDEHHTICSLEPVWGICFAHALEPIYTQRGLLRLQLPTWASSSIPFQHPSLVKDMPEICLEHRPGIRFSPLSKPHWFALRHAMLHRTKFYVDHAEDDALVCLLCNAVQLCIAHG